MEDKLLFIDENPLVSVIIPVYNTEKYIGNTLDSVIKQTYPNIEVVIVDDGSTDNSAKVIKEYINKYQNIHYHYQENNGVSSARNKGIDISTGDYIAFIDADDLWEPDKIVKQMKRLLDTGSDFCYCGLKDQINGVITHGFYPENYPEGKILNDVLTGKTIISTITWVVKKSFIVNNDIFFTAGLNIGEDQEFLYKILTLTNSCSVPEKLSIYVKRDFSLTAYHEIFNKNAIKNLDAIKSYLRWFKAQGYTKSYNDEIEEFVVNTIVIKTVVNFVFKGIKKRQAFVELDDIYHLHKIIKETSVKKVMRFLPCKFVLKLLFIKIFYPVYDTFQRKKHKNTTLKVVHVSINDISGGASKAAYRIHRALLKNGFDSKMVVLNKTSDDETVYQIKSSILKRRIIGKLNRIVSRDLDKTKGEFSIPFFGYNIENEMFIKSADIIHLHWINGNFLSINSIKRVLKSGKKVIWTAHDMWPFTGGCHYSNGCDKYKSACGNCHFVNGCKKNDIAAKIFSVKKKLFEKYPITLVACSRWLSKCAEESSIFSKKNVYNIPNTLDTAVFKPLSNVKKDKIYIVFGACSAISDKRKGWEYLVEALRIFENRYSDLAAVCEVLVFGVDKITEKLMVSMKIKPSGYINSDNDLVELYNKAAVFLAPSLEDNLPNTILESMSCGVPCAAFATGGIGDLIDHMSNGYTARLKDSSDLADGIAWCVINHDIAGKNARTKICDLFNEKTVSEKISTIYRSL